MSDKDDKCEFPLCKFSAHREGYCIHHAKHFAGPKPIAEKKKISIKSVKRIAEDKLLDKIRKEMKTESDVCEIKAPGCTGKMEGLHHVQKSSPSNRVVRKNLKRACNSCNGFIERFPDWATKNKMTKSRFK